MAEAADRDRVRDATDIVDLVSEVTKVKKTGRSFMAICPFHEEKTPSMSVDRAKGLYHCFGCGEGGDVFTFVEKTQGVGFADAMEILARRAGITLTQEPDQAQRSGRRAEAVDAIRRAVEVYHDRLKRSPDAGPARAYLRSRGYEVSVIDEWRIGFAGMDWDTLTKTLRTGGVGERAMLDAGLARRGRHGLFDVFRGRLLFPIHDVRGDPVGFGGRRVDGVDPRATNNPEAKYVNSADSVVYHKSRLLFGLDRARQAIGSEGEAVVVEGYTDVIAMHLAGVNTAVATCGTALGDGHFDLLRRFTERVVLAFDSDAAGEKAALRSDELESPFRLDLDLRVAVMPDGLDPADLVQQGRSEELLQSVKEARPLLEHRIEHEVARHDLGGPEGRARALHAAAAQVRRVNDEIARSEYVRYVARLIGVDMVTVERAVAGRSTASTGATAKGDLPLDRFESGLLRVLVADPDRRSEVKADDFRDVRLKDGFLALAEGIDPAAVADPTVRNLLLSLVMDERPLPDWEDLARLLQMRRLDDRIDVLEGRIETLTPGSDAHSDSLRELIALQQERRSLGYQ
ncbi:MAG: DNA primase [Actinobacteria bacterium]|nr:DNA primase [Actinomycetota bacterium]